jgi:hypothetical protein
MLEAVVKERGLCDYFGHLAGNTNIFAASKADYGKTLLKKIGLKKEEVLLVGDTAHDFEVARELGVNCILVSCGHYSAGRLRSLGVPVFADLFQAARQLSREALPSPTVNEQALPAKSAPVSVFRTNLAKCGDTVLVAFFTGLFFYWIEVYAGRHGWDPRLVTPFSEVVKGQMDLLSVLSSSR